VTSVSIGGLHCRGGYRGRGPPLGHSAVECAPSARNAYRGSQCSIAHQRGSSIARTVDETVDAAVAAVLVDLPQAAATAPDGQQAD